MYVVTNPVVKILVKIVSSLNFISEALYSGEISWITHFSSDLDLMSVKLCIKLRKVSRWIFFLYALNRWVLHFLVMCVLKFVSIKLWFQFNWGLIIFRCLTQIRFFWIGLWNKNYIISQFLKVICSANRKK